MAHSDNAPADGRKGTARFDGRQIAVGGHYGGSAREPVGADSLLDTIGRSRDVPN